MSPGKVETRVCGYTQIYICIYIYRYRYRYIYLKILHIGYKRSSQVSLFPGKEEYLKSAKVLMENGIFQTQIEILILDFILSVRKGKFEHHAI